MEINKWPKCLSTCNSCGSLIKKWTYIYETMNKWAQLPLKLEIWINLVSYCVHIISNISWILYSILIFVSIYYEYIIFFHASLVLLTSKSEILSVSKPTNRHTYYWIGEYESALYVIVYKFSQLFNNFCIM